MPNEYVSGLRCRVTLYCAVHTNNMTFIPNGNGGGLWHCSEGCTVQLSMQWRPATVKVNNEARVG